MHVHVMHAAPGVHASPVDQPPPARRRRRRRRTHRRTRRMPADEAVLLGAFRDSLQLHFGDHGLGSALASFQGASMCWSVCTLH
jgi:hypothetical protein